MVSQMLMLISPNFQPENFETNMKLMKELEKFARKKNYSSAPLALAWIRSLTCKEGTLKIISSTGATTAESEGECC